MWMFIEAIKLLFDVLYWLIIARIILSWVVRNPYNKYYAILGQITEPILAPFRNLLFKIGGGKYGIDFSPILALLALQIVRNILIRLIVLIF